MSFVLDRRAPAPANVGRSQFGTGSRAGLCPGARRACISGESAMPVWRIPSGPVHARADESFVVHARTPRQHVAEQPDAEVRVLDRGPDVARELVP